MISRFSSSGAKFGSRFCLLILLLEYLWDDLLPFLLPPLSPLPCPPFSFSLPISIPLLLLPPHLCLPHCLCLKSHFFHLAVSKCFVIFHGHVCDLSQTFLLLKWCVSECFVVNCRKEWLQSLVSLSFVSCLLSPKFVSFSCLLSHASCLPPPISCLMPPVSRLLSHIFCLTSPVSCLLSQIFCLTAPVSWLLSLISCLTSPVSCLLSTVSCLRSPNSSLLSHSSRVSDSCLNSHLLSHFSCLRSPVSHTGILS